MSELEQTLTPADQGGIIDEKELGRANGILREYREGKKPIDDRIKEAERWWLLKQWEVYDKNADGKAGSKNDRRTASAWLFNAIVGAQADAVEAYPEPIFYPRERGDEKEADTLSKIVPVILQQSELYASAAFVAGAVFVVLEVFVPGTGASLIAVGVGGGICVLARKRGWRLPTEPRWIAVRPKE